MSDEPSLADGETEGSACPVDPAGGDVDSTAPTGDGSSVGAGFPPARPSDAEDDPLAPRGSQKCCALSCIVPAVLVLLCVISGYTLDKRFTLSTSRTIAAPPAKIFPTFNSKTGIQDWWKGFSEQMEKAGSTGAPMRVVAVDGPGAGVGAGVDFQMGATVTERWEIIESVPNEKVVYDVHFVTMDMSVVRTITLVPEGDGTRVTWSETGELENPMLRWMTKLSADGVIKNFDLALDGVARIAEQP